MIRTIKNTGKAAYDLFNSLSIDISGYIAYMTFLAFFPFLLLLVSIAGYFGSSEAAQLTIHELYDMLPNEVVEVLSPIIMEVTDAPPSGLLGIAILSILWISSSSVEALRLGLNNAYDLNEDRSFWWRRGQSFLFTILGSLSFFFATTITVLLPIANKVWRYLDELFNLSDFDFQISSELNISRLALAFGILLFSQMVIYKWLPNHRVKMFACFNGAFLSSLLWIGIASLYSLYLQNIARYDLIYGSFGGIIITLIFFQISAALILYGAHFNKLSTKK